MARGLVIAAGKPFTATFQDLSAALFPLHLNEKAWVDRLHDIWKQGAPTPSSIIRSPKDYDERVQQRGNHEARLVLPTPLATWVMQVSAARGQPVSWRQALRMVEGQADYGLDARR